jgi:hypothetical protein
MEQAAAHGIALRPYSIETPWTTSTPPKTPTAPFQKELASICLSLPAQVIKMTRSGRIASNHPTEWMLRTALRAWLALPTRGSAMMGERFISPRCRLGAGPGTVVRAGATPGSGPSARPNEPGVAPARTTRNAWPDLTAGLLEKAGLVRFARESRGDSSTDSVEDLSGIREMDRAGTLNERRVRTVTPELRPPANSLCQSGRDCSVTDV